ncbi:LPD29 domain-containing protein [Mixta intestinalis]|uniref:Large polyvalent protein associated domain-containing protein n=1 Tax=Mixta intestinalis TaxID=1615494 RepID=A0A6P1Q7M5_9GAMM|nr:LPD29 domain-containing protein [Mixta intestinalis]QHM74037.1 hypothetical protein C7M51_04398 [Mixta intestinalis]
MIQRSQGRQVVSHIRKDLKIEFPGVKFSVKKQSIDSISINWTNGPTEKEVRRIIVKYSSDFVEIKYIFTDRHYSDVMKRKAVEMIIRKFGRYLDGEEITLERFNKGELYHVGQVYFRHGQGVQGEIKATLENMKE